MKENPYELLYMYRMGDRYAEKRLYTIYKPYAEMVVRTFLKKNEYLRGYEEDLSQECMIAVFTAVKRYRQDKDSSFRTFVNVLVKRRLFQKAKWYRNSLFAEGKIVTEWDDEITESLQRSELTQKYRMYEPEYYLKYRIAEENLMNSFSYMSKQDRKVLALWDTGKSYVEAAESLGCTSKQYETRLRSLRKSIYRSVDARRFRLKKKKRVTENDGKQEK